LSVDVPEALQKHKLPVFFSSKWLYRCENPLYSEAQEATALALVELSRTRKRSGFSDDSPAKQHRGAMLTHPLPTSVEELNLGLSLSFPDVRSRVLAEVLEAKEDSRPALQPFDKSSRPSTATVALPQVVSVAVDSPTKSVPRPSTAPAASPALWKPPSEIVSGRTFTVAFSDSSLKNAQHSGLIDFEGLRTLREYSKAHGGSITNETFVLRSPEAAASVSLPDLKECLPSELSFGSQKQLYSNANKILEHNNRKSKKLTQHLITMSRIEKDVRRAKSSRMVHALEPGELVSDEGLLLNLSTPEQSEALAGLRSAQRIMASSSKVPSDLLSQRRSLDLEQVRESMGVCRSATENEVMREISREMLSAKTHPHHSRSLQHPRMADENKTALEKKLQTAIVKKLGEGEVLRMSSGGAKKKLTTRDLLPFYRLEEVQHFLDIFSAVDRDQNGALDMR
jgi:hypothetical protein